MEDFELIAPNGTDINNEFLKAYRDSLKNQYDANISSLNQHRRNNDTSIMSAANERGMMYSNFPQRSKIQSETEYLNNLSKLNSTYQTGLNSLRNNAVNAYNQIKAYEEAISDLQSSASGGGGSGTTGTTGTTGTNGTNGTTTTDNKGSLSDTPNGVTFNDNDKQKFINENQDKIKGTIGKVLKDLGGITIDWDSIDDKSLYELMYPNDMPGDWKKSWGEIAEQLK